MRQYKFKMNGRNYHRVNKATARRAWKDGAPVIFCARNLRPDGFFGFSVEMRADGSEYNRDEFEKAVNSFEFYNCNLNECGKYAAFYTEVK